MKVASRIGPPAEWAVGATTSLPPATEPAQDPAARAAGRPVPSRTTPAIRRPELSWDPEPPVGTVGPVKGGGRSGVVIGIRTGAGAFSVSRMRARRGPPLRLPSGGAR